MQELFIMTKAKPGDSVIAYIQDSTACVGIVINIYGVDERDRQGVTLLVLGWFTTNEAPPNADVFSEQVIHPFPTYERIRESQLFPYDFEREIKLCQDRDDTWWRSCNPPCSSNLVLWHFSPKQLNALRYISIARHILSGGDINGYKNFDGVFDHQAFLELWATLHYFFPDRTAEPPTQYDCPNSNVFYTIVVKKGKPSVEVGFR